jgi:hypothetical protein
MDLAGTPARKASGLALLLQDLREDSSQGSRPILGRVPRADGLTDRSLQAPQDGPTHGAVGDPLGGYES